MTAIGKAVKVIGTQEVLASALGVKQNYVSRWININKQAPAKYIPAISDLTNGEVTIEELLADHVNNAMKNKAVNHAN